MSKTPEGVYRDGAPGVEARTADLRAVWADRAKQVSPPAQAVLRARLKRIAAGKAAIFMQLLIIVALATRLVPWLHVHESGCVRTPPELIGGYFFMAFAVIK